MPSVKPKLQLAELKLILVLTENEKDYQEVK
jgi:hypothetical protein